MRPKGKVMVVISSDDEESGHEFVGDQERNFITFTITTTVGEFEIVDENPFDGELSENANL